MLDSVGQAAKEIEKTFGKLDVLINVAGVMGSMAKIADSDPEDWWQTSTHRRLSVERSNADSSMAVAVSVCGPYLISCACIPFLLKGDSKVLVNVSSVGGLVTGPRRSAYQTSKTAVIRLTDLIAAEYAEQGLTTFCVHPGNILTDIVGDGHGMDGSLKAVFTETPRLCADTLV